MRVAGGSAASLRFSVGEDACLQRHLPAARELHGSPGDGAISPLTGGVYVDGGVTRVGVQVISGKTNKVIGTALTGAGPIQVAVSPKTGEAYATNSDGANVWVISG